MILPEQRPAKVSVFLERRTMMETLVWSGRLHHLRLNAMVPRSPIADRALIRWNPDLCLGLVSDDADVLLVSRSLCEHTQLEHPAPPAIEFDDHVPVVENVGLSTVVTLVAMVDGLCA